MRHSKFLFFLPLLGLTACDKDPMTNNPAQPAAVVRFVNVNVDTGTVDLRFTDRVENLPSFLGVPFRGHSGVYQRVAPGARPAVVFPSASNINLTQIRLVEQTVNLTADTRVTLVYAGRAAAGAPAAQQDQLAVIQEPFVLPAPAAGSIALQALHAAVGVGPVDVYVVPVASLTATTPATFATSNAGVFRNVAYLSKAADYITVPVRPSGGFYRFVVTNAGSTTALFAVTPNQPGVAQPAAGTFGPQPGMQISGSVMTAVISAGTTAGTRQATTATNANSIFMLIDKTLPRVAPPTP
jgi:hypothetical protein